MRGTLGRPDRAPTPPVSSIPGRWECLDMWGAASAVMVQAWPCAPGHSPSCPRTESDPAFTFSFFSGLPLGPSWPFLFESLFLPFVFLPDRSASGKERARGRWLPQAGQTEPRPLRGIPGGPHHLVSRLLDHLPCTSAAPVQSHVGPGVTVAPASQGTADVGKAGKSP